MEPGTPMSVEEEEEAWPAHGRRRRTNIPCNLLSPSSPAWRTLQLLSTSRPDHERLRAWQRWGAHECQLLAARPTSTQIMPPAAIHHAGLKLYQRG